MPDWLIVLSIVVSWILGANAVLLAQNLRSRRKRPEPGSHRHSQYCKLLVYDGKNWVPFLVETSPPSSPPTPGTTKRP